MIKNIVVHLTGSEEDDTRLAYGLQVARLFDAHLTGLQVHTLPEISIITEPSGGALLQDLIAESSERADAAGRKLAAKFEGFDVEHELRRLDAFPGAVGPTLAAETRLADLFIGTRPYGDPTRQQRVEEAVLFGSGRGSLLVPPHSKPPTSYNTVIVGWNDSREAARAVAEALPFLQQARQVVVCIVEENGASEQAGIEAGADIGRYLSRHNVLAEIHKLAGWDEPGAALLNEAKQLGADLIVMGGYGHSRVREWILGGATRLMLSEAPMPVLVAH